MEDKIVASVRVSQDIWKLAKKRAIDFDMTVSDFVETAILHEIREKQI